MKVTRPMSDWLVEKIASILSTREGFTRIGSKQVDTNPVVEVIDAFGFRYEIQIKATGRLSDNKSEIETKLLA